MYEIQYIENKRVKNIYIHKIVVNGGVSINKNVVQITLTEKPSNYINYSGHKTNVRKQELKI